jgi:YD repeat-containing protein
MVARQTWPVKRLLGVLIGAALVLPGTAAGKRLPDPIEISESGVRGVDDAEEQARVEAQPFTLGPDEEWACRLDLAAGHQGLGTLADVFVEGPAGVRVNLLSGNLVWQQHLLPHGVPVTRLAFTLTWNAQHQPRRDRALPQGWSHRFETSLVPDAWGVMDLLEHDGFVHRFYAMLEGIPYSRDALVEEIVDRRRRGGMPPGEGVPGGVRFRRMLEQDDAFLGAMRSRFMGGGSWIEGRYVSEARGHQLLQMGDDGSAACLRGDGTVERFDPAGLLVAIEPVARPAVVVERTAGEISAVTMEQGPSLGLEHDGRGELVRVRGEVGRDVRLEREHGRLVRLRTPSGDWRFEYDDAGALVAIEGPHTWARVRYDGDRVASLEGPTGTVSFDYELAGEVLRGRASGPAGDISVVLDLASGERVVRGPSGERVVRFDAGFNRPLQAGVATLEYDAFGNVVAVDHPAGRLSVATDGSGRARRLEVPGGGVIAIETDEAGRLVQATDGAGVRLEYRYGSRGELVREGDGLGATTFEHNTWGELTQVRQPSGDVVYLERDAAGRPVRCSTSGGLQTRLGWDEADRLVRLETADRQDVQVLHGSRGLLKVVDPRGQVLAFTVGEDGRLTSMERTGVPLRLSVQRDGASRVAALVTDGWTARIERADGRLGSVRGLVGGALGYGWGSSVVGPVLSEVSWGDGRWRFEHDATTGRPRRAAGGLGEELRVVYGGDGRLQQLARGAALPWVVQRDAGGRPQTVDPGDGTPVSLSCDRAGRVVEVHDGTVALLRATRDSQGRATAAEVREAGVWQLAHGLHGWPRVLTGPEAERFDLEIDARARVVGMTWPGGGRGEVGWTLHGDLQRLAGSWGELALTFDPAGRVTELVAPGQRPARFAWERSRVTLGDGRVLEFDERGALRGLPADLPTGSSGTPGPAPDAVAQALLQPWLPAPWATHGRAASGPGSVIGAPVPRWVVDRAWSAVDSGWSAVLPAPPGLGVPVPDPAAGEAVTVAGLLVLLGFLPSDLAEHRALLPLPPPPQLVRCPAVRELRALAAVRQAGPFDAGIPAVTVDLAARGVALHPDGMAVGHPVPWAAVADPLALSRPAWEARGAATPEVVAAWPGVAAEPLAGALELGRWLSSTPLAALDPDAGLTPDLAGAYRAWTAGRLQAVVDDRGRLRGLDAGATAVASSNRALVGDFFGGATSGRAPAMTLAPSWLPSPGAAPEAAVGWLPGPGSAWPDPFGRVYEVVDDTR